MKHSRAAATGFLHDGCGHFYSHGGRWYHGRHDNGPWFLATRSIPPPVLLRRGIDDIRRYRDLEFGRYRDDGEHYAGRFHHPEFRAERPGFAGRGEEFR